MPDLFKLGDKAWAKKHSFHTTLHSRSGVVNLCYDFLFRVDFGKGEMQWFTQNGIVLIYRKMSWT